MGSIQLLDRTRRIGRLLRDGEVGRISFEDICKILSADTGSSCLVITRKGKLLGIANHPDVVKLEEFLTDNIGDVLDASFTGRLNEILSTKENVNLGTLGFEKTDSHRYKVIVTPIYISGDRLGSLILYRNEGDYDLDDIILCEFSSSIIGLEMLYSMTEEVEKENRLANSARMAMSSLSDTETEALVEVFDEMNGLEGILVASKIADRMGITRSVIVNALRKLESAGVIESKSSGMKGTYIKILNGYIFDEIEKVKG